ncbi:MAG: lactate utilization protein [Firmicutes bacterium]|nr:lactate utilization protein [Bacillota bacterium]
MFEQLKKTLEDKGYEVLTFASGKEAAEALDALIDGKTVGIGGSMTVEQTGLYERLASHNTVSWHHRVPEGVDPVEVRNAAARSQIYISSVNGIAETGEIVNIDNTGNRVAAISYGPKTVYLLVGKNKIAPDFGAALWRARNVAAPLNARRLNRKTPCAVKADKCYDCSSPDRICRNLSVLWTAPRGAKYVVTLIDEELGY